MCAGPLLGVDQTGETTMHCFRHGGTHHKAALLGQLQSIRIRLLSSVGYSKLTVVSIVDACLQSTTFLIEIIPNKSSMVIKEAYPHDGIIDTAIVF